MVQSNSIERSIFELLIFVKLVLKIDKSSWRIEFNTSVHPGVQHVSFENAEIPEEWLQMSCGLLALNVAVEGAQNFSLNS